MHPPKKYHTKSKIDESLFDIYVLRVSKQLRIWKLPGVLGGVARVAKRRSAAASAAADTWRVGATRGLGGTGQSTGGSRQDAWNVKGLYGGGHERFTELLYPTN